MAASTSPSPLATLREDVRSAAAKLAETAGDRAIQPTLERPKRDGFGDYSTNAALLLAPVLKAKPRDVGEQLRVELAGRLGDRVEKVELAGPGFLNLFLSDAWHCEAADHVLAAGQDWGGGGAHPRERVLVEFVSANPTGPMHVGHARNAAYGDALARLLEFRGHRVEREFYINDFGTQVRKLGESIQARALGRELPEGGYQGDYVVELARDIRDAAELDVEEVARRGIELMVQRTRASLERFRVSFDSWFAEHTLHEGRPSLVQHAFDVLEEQQRSYRSEGALWLRTTAFGDDKDRVLERSSGDHTYFASDIAYHQEKRERGFDRLIDVLGADHHGYVGRMHAAFQALGGESDRLELLIMQFVHLISRGERASMSKRSGQFVTLDDLLEEIGVDAARWFLLARSHDTTIDLDLDLAREQSSDNPVYYVQYAHARISSVLERLGAQRVDDALGPEPSAGVALERAERELVKKLLAFPDEVAEAELRRSPHRVAVYALELAQVFTAFYRDCKVIGAQPVAVETSRIRLCAAARATLARALDLLGVAAPRSM
jgi:arginyl-tRNA synthetase